ncbi:MAG: NUDIX hydrolase [Acidimicrobiales bacterium]|nr:NUDIX hydrolase [Acidimicrobiales bacterium]
MASEELIPAATVILGRNGSSGLEILMLKRNSKIAFGGAWVFPGGRVDPGDSGSGELEKARSAAVRESGEETGLVVKHASMHVWSYWAPPQAQEMVTSGTKRRFSTWFFFAPAPANDLVTVDMGEIQEHRWLPPAEAIDLHRRAEIELIPPTWVTLHQLASHSTTESVTRAASGSFDPPQFVTRPIPGDPVILTWEGDVAYDDRSLRDSPGARNRLTMSAGNWFYERRQ